jgi:hypothetical protein
LRIEEHTVIEAAAHDATVTVPDSRTRSGARELAERTKEKVQHPFSPRQFFLDFLMVVTGTIRLGCETGFAPPASSNATAIYSVGRCSVNET